MMARDLSLEVLENVCSFLSDDVFHLSTVAMVRTIWSLAVLTHAKRLRFALGIPRPGGS